MGLPSAAAMCIAPPSQHITSPHTLIAAISSPSLLVLYKTAPLILPAIASAFSSSPGWNGFLLLPGAQSIKGIMLYLFISSLPSSINLSIGQRLFSFLVLMCMATILGCLPPNACVGGGMPAPECLCRGWDACPRMLVSGVGCGNKNFKTFSFSSSDGNKTSLEGSPSIPSGSRSLNVATTSWIGSLGSLIGML